MNHIDEAEIRRVLTADGAIPDGYAFIVDLAIYVWNPNAHFQRLFLHSDDIARACIDYLTARNRVFYTLEDAAAHIIDEKWLHWEKLLRPMQ